MQTLHPGLITAQRAARDEGIAPVSFFWIAAKNRTTGAIETMGLWTGDQDIPVNVQTPEGGLETRIYLGGTNLSVDTIQLVADLTDNPVTVSMSQIADATQQLVRGYDVRLAYCEIHSTSWVRGEFASPPQLQTVGIVDDSDVETPSAGGTGAISLIVRSELMTQLMAINPAKSSDSHQKRRQAGDRFSEYSGAIRARKVQWRKD
ncbi:hypothetical protein ACIPCF_07675 [Paracoccus marcusii]|uniref:hypothetical protein n=1 Tax=Paracoccus marcusii TaxID=59779 RepID=UPI0038B7270B